ncbi:MAG: CDP-diacylglycerol--serine O-phosphatidyltransferase [archaeon]
MSLKEIIPNGLTLVNIVCGFVSIIMVFHGYSTIAAILILVAVVLDFLDGFSARLLKAESKIGVQLDSLADLVSFGIAPAILMYSLFINNILLVIAILFVLAGAYRLARFNALKNKVKGFVGMPITVNGVLFPVLYFFNVNFYMVAVVFIISMFLMISRIRFKKVI